MRIIIADDDADDLSMATETLVHINKDIEVQTAKDGQELITLLQNDATQNALPNLVLLDLNMPRKDGRTALKEIKSNPALKQVNVIIFSTSKSEEDKRLTLELGASSYIVKPADYNVLVDVFKKINNELFASL
jgi:DNA-binding response OmpR family regulator